MQKKISMTVSKKMTFEEAYSQFIRIRKLLNLSEASIRHYNGTYARFIAFLDKGTLCAEITNETVFQFIEFLKEENKDIKTRSINSYLIDLRAIFNYLAEENIMQPFKLKLLRDEQKIKETFTDDELEKLLKKPDMKNVSFCQYRVWVIENYLLGTGNRAGTVCELKLSDIDFENHEIKLRKLKGKRQYFIPLSSALEKILKEYVQFRKPELDDYLFCNQYGAQLTYNALNESIARYNKGKGVNKTSIHLFRHTFAKRWILSGGDIFRLQKILGHQSLEMVKNYVHMYNGDLKINFDNFNPLDNMKTNHQAHLCMKKC